MAKEVTSRQEEQINLIIKRIDELLKGQLKTETISTMIGRVIQMREHHESEQSIREYLSAVSGLKADDFKIDVLLAEIEEKPLQNSYFPFKGSILEELRKNLED